jgi:malate synthase
LKFNSGAEEIQDGENIELFDDTASMATSVSHRSTVLTRSSVLTTTTNRSSRQRRKQEKRRATGKDPFYRDEYLIGELKKLYDNFNTSSVVVYKTTVQMLIRYGDLESAEKVQNAVKNCHATLSQHCSIIFDVGVICRPGDESQIEKAKVANVEWLSVFS